jgi:hypothetical protein
MSLKLARFARMIFRSVIQNALAFRPDDTEYSNTISFMYVIDFELFSNRS